MVGNKLGCYRTFSIRVPLSLITLIIHPYSFLYILYLAIDGNFKLKGKERNVKDVELMPGLSAYVTETDYKSHIANYVDQPEVHFTSSSCSIN
jgi:hypothetical protein